MKYIQKLSISNIPMEPLASRSKMCYFCLEYEKKEQDTCSYKNFSVLKNFITETGRIQSFRITGLCRSHQKKLKKAIDRARSLGLLPTGGRD